MTAHMALPSTLHRFDVSLALVDRGVDRAFQLTAARHPSETIERLWLRVLALCWRWEEGIAFGPGLCEPDAPDALVPGPGGARAALVRVGAPAPERVERDIRGNAGARVAVLFESEERMAAFVSAARAGGLARALGAELAAVERRFLADLARTDDRRVRLSVTLVDDHLYVEADGRTVDGPLHRAVLPVE